MKSETFSFASIPASLAEFQSLPEAELKSPFATAALLVLAYNAYPSNKDASLEMVNFLKGPDALTPMDKQFIRDRFMDGKDYVPRSYFAGTSPANSYKANVPYTVTVEDNPYSYQNENYATLYIRSSGADSARPVTLRCKPSTGQWFVFSDSFKAILTGIRTPADQDPWA